MKTAMKHVVWILAAALVLAGCSSMNRTQKGAVVGTASGAAMGAIIGEASGNAALGTIIGATVGGATGAVIGHQMDKQAEEIAESVPDARVERVGEGIVVEFNSNVLFGFDRSDLSDEAKENLDKLVLVLDHYPDTNIEIQGHTDSSGPEDYNQSLSERRAASVAAYLADQEVNDDRLKTVGFGETTPRYDNETEEGRTQNRRVDFLITANEKMISEAAEEANK